MKVKVISFHRIPPNNGIIQRSFYFLPLISWSEFKGNVSIYFGWLNWTVMFYEFEPMGLFAAEVLICCATVFLYSMLIMFVI